MERIISGELAGMGSLLLLFLSHGDENKNVNYFHTADHKIISVQEIRRFLTNTKCPSMIGKPKIAFFNFCRGSVAEVKSLISFDSVKQEKSEEIPEDFAIVQAAQPGIMAARTSDGTVFVSSLCDILREHARTKEIKDIITLTSELMKKKNGSTASIELILFRKNFFFY